jgi:hypothetical protein
MRHRWSAWYPIHAGLLERRCAGCGDVERITPEALVESVAGDAIARLRVMRAALENGGDGHG